MLERAASQTDLDKAMDKVTDAFIIILSDAGFIVELSRLPDHSSRMVLAFALNFFATKETFMGYSILGSTRGYSGGKLKGKVSWLSLLGAWEVQGTWSVDTFQDLGLLLTGSGKIVTENHWYGGVADISKIESKNLVVDVGNSSRYGFWLVKGGAKFKGCGVGCDALDTGSGVWRSIVLSGAAEHLYMVIQGEGQTDLYLGLRAEANLSSQKGIILTILSGSITPGALSKLLELQKIDVYVDDGWPESSKSVNITVQYEDPDKIIVRGSSIVTVNKQRPSSLFDPVGEETHTHRAMTDRSGPDSDAAPIPIDNGKGIGAAVIAGIVVGVIVIAIIVGVILLMRHRAQKKKERSESYSSSSSSSSRKTRRKSKAKRSNRTAKKAPRNVDVEQVHEASRVQEGGIPVSVPVQEPVVQTQQQVEPGVQADYNDNCVMAPPGYEPDTQDCPPPPDQSQDTRKNTQQFYGFQQPSPGQSQYPGSATDWQQAQFQAGYPGYQGVTGQAQFQSGPGFGSHVPY
jgi:hypothetical protein